MATNPSIPLSYPYQLLASNVADLLAWDVLKGVLGHTRGVPDGLPQGPVRPSGETPEGQGVPHE